MSPKWPKIMVFGYKTPGNDDFDLKFGMGKFFVMRKPMKFFLPLPSRRALQGAPIHSTNLHTISNLKLLFLRLAR